MIDDKTNGPASDLREAGQGWNNRLANWLLALALLALMGAGVREMLIYNGKLTSDLNANGFSITNLPAGFFPDADAALAEFARTNAVLKAGPYVKRDSTTPSGQTLGGGFRVKGWISSTGTVSVVRDGPSLLEVRKPQTWMDFDCFGLGWGTGGWVFDKDGFRRQFQEFPMGPWALGPAFSFPEDAYETGGVLALRSDIPDMDGYATEADAANAARSAVEPVSNLVETVRAESALVYRLYQGSNVVAEVTNYNSSVHAPELRLMQLNESNEYVTVWAETNGLSRTLASARQYTDDATGAVVQAVAPRAWSKVTAGMGVEAPSNTTWLSTARTVIAGGLDYEKHVTSGGAIWLLESNGMTPDFHPQTNNTAFLDLANADGTPIFRVEKTDSFLVGVHIDDVTVDGDALVCSVGVVAAEHPLVRVRDSLSSGDWIKEEDGIPASLATVTWSGSTGNWTCRVQNNTGGGQFFAQMEYLQEGGTKIVNAAPMSVSAGILCTDGIHKCRPVYSNGNITWEVVP